MLRRLRYWTNSARRSEALREEMELHLAEKAAELQAGGMSAERAQAEARAVAAAHGVVLDDSPDVRDGPKRVYFDHRPSILQDYDLGRPMEIEAIVRAPVAFARSAGVATPTLDAIEAFTVSMATSKGLYAAD